MFKFLRDYLSVRKHLKQERNIQIKKIRIYYKFFFKEQLYSWLGHYFTQKIITIDPLSDKNDNQVNYSGEELNVDDYITEEIARNVQKEQDEHGIIFDDMDKYNTIQLKEVIDVNLEQPDDGGGTFVDFIYENTDNQSIKDYIDKKKEELNNE